ncbi:MAG TPA: ArsR family transcriptional regulator, partial [Thermoplasmata archaeon]|nr:ArsR family transcriptional regulator [Thermoplasmata archaeon]
MNRIKVVSEPAELVPILRAVDTEVKRDVFKEVSTDWRTLK